MVRSAGVEPIYAERVVAEKAQPASSRMKIGLIIYGSIDTISGGYLYDRKLVEHLRQQGDQVEILSLPRRNYAGQLFDNISGSLRRRIEEGGFDLLIQDELNHPSLFWLNLGLKSQLHAPIVSIVHHLRCSEAHNRREKILYRWVERRYLQSVDAFIFNSAATRRAVEALAGVRTPSIIAHPAGDQLYPALTEAEVVSRARQTGPLRFLFLGNVIPRKGLHVLLAALDRIKDLDWTLWIAGDLSADPGYARSLKKQADRLELGDRVTLLGILGEDVLASRMRRSHLLVVSSFHEGFGIAYLEGMGFGLPAIATTSGGASEIITHGVNGFLAPPGDVDGLAAILRWVLEDRRLLVTLSLAALRRYTQQPTWEETSERIRGFLLGLIDENRSKKLGSTGQNSYKGKK